MLLPLVAIALAAPESVSIVAMDDYGGNSTVALDNDFVATGYRTMARELGFAIANKPMAPAETLGMDGFQVGIVNTFAFIRTGSLDGTNPSGWDLADPDEDPQTFLFIPQLQLRKGLPLSFEVGANAGWIGQTETGTLGAYGRFAPLEGYRQLPDLALQVGYTGYVGNDELELGVVDMSATLGYTLPFGVTEKIHQAQFSPYVGIGLAQIHAAPRADLDGTLLEGRITDVSGTRTGETYDASFAPLTLGGGFRILNGDFAATFAASYAPGLIATANLGFGFVY